MEVYVNEELHEPPVDPVGQGTVKNFLETLDEEFAEVNRVIYSVKIDGEEIKEDVDKKLDKVACEEVERLELKVQTMDKMAIDSIANLGEYCHTFLSRLPDVVGKWEKKNDEEKEKHRDEIKEALGFAQEILNSVAIVLNMPSKKLKKLQDRAEEIEPVIDRADHEKLEQLLREDCREFIEDLLEQLQNYMDELQLRKEQARDTAARISQLIDKMLGRLPELIDNLQGDPEEEQVGLGEIENVFEQLEEILNSISTLDDQGEIKKILDRETQEKMIKSQDQLVTGLVELEKALEDRDLIMICDILEYEVKPYLENLKPIFQQNN